MTLFKINGMIFFLNHAEENILEWANTEGKIMELLTFLKPILWNWLRKKKKE